MPGLRDLIWRMNTYVARTDIGDFLGRFERMAYAYDLVEPEELGIIVRLLCLELHSTTAS